MKNPGKVRALDQDRASRSRGSMVSGSSVASAESSAHPSTPQLLTQPSRVLGKRQYHARPGPNQPLGAPNPQN